MFNNIETYKKPEKSGENLDWLMKSIAQKLNDELQELGEPPLLEEDNSISAEAFKIFPDIVADEKDVLKKDIEWSVAENPNTQEYYKEKFGVEGTKEIVRQYRKNKAKRPSAQLEKAITGLLYRILQADFLVMRSTKFDDYFNGIDNVIVNKETGDVICAFDGVHDEENGERQIEKVKKIVKIARGGGAKFKYGVTFEKDEMTGEKKLVKKTIWHLPVFYLGLSSGELKKLISGMNYDIDGKVNQVELEIFNKLIISLKEQVKILEKERTAPFVKENLKKFKVFLHQMEELKTAIA